jgi:6,7-dimethyl-8-ribityllumazine synthase
LPTEVRSFGPAAASANWSRPILCANMSPTVAIIVSRYNASITDALVEGARAEYAARSDGSESPAVYDAPGTYELPALALAAAETGRYRGIVALGCLIRGETRHDRYIAESVAHGLMQVSLQTGVPVAFGVLTVESPKQARARAGGEKGNKGREAMAAVLDTLASMDAIRRGKPPDDSARSTAAARPDKAGARA